MFSFIAPQEGPSVLRRGCWWTRRGVTSYPATRTGGSRVSGTTVRSTQGPVVLGSNTGMSSATRRMAPEPTSRGKNQGPVVLGSNTGMLFATRRMAPEPTSRGKNQGPVVLGFNSGMSSATRRTVPEPTSRGKNQGPVVLGSNTGMSSATRRMVPEPTSRGKNKVTLTENYKNNNRQEIQISNVEMTWLLLASVCVWVILLSLSSVYSQYLNCQ